MDTQKSIDVGALDRPTPTEKVGSSREANVKYDGLVSVGGELLVRILLVGTRVLPYRHGGDKNFWLDVIHGLAKADHELEVLSVMVEDETGYDFPVRRVEPIPMYLGTDSRFNASYDHLAATNNYTSKTISLPRILREVRLRRREFRPDVIHFMDNYGPAMAGMGAATGGLPTAVSAPTYNRYSRFYDLFLKMSFRGFDAIVPFSEAYRRRLLELHVPPERIRRIRWGVDVARFTPPSASERAAAKEALGARADDFVVLWTGFTQQTDERALDSALRIAVRSLREDDAHVVFAFCFKPEHFKEAYRGFERPGLRVFGTADAFRTARTSADVLLSPIQDAGSTAAPPLVWLECLAMGIPIVTTAVPGADEAAVEDRSGFAVATEAEASERLHGMRTDADLRRRLQIGARETAVERYSVDRAVKEYVQLWASLSANRDS